MKTKLDQSYRVKANMFVHDSYLKYHRDPFKVTPTEADEIITYLAFFSPLYYNIKNINDIIISRLYQVTMNSRSYQVLSFAENLQSIDKYYYQKSPHMVNPFLTDIAMFIGV